jgi:hypothetical protein
VYHCKPLAISYPNFIPAKKTLIPERAQPVPVFVNLLWSPGIDSQPDVPVRQPYLSYRPAILHRQVESIPGLLKRLQIWLRNLFGFADWGGVRMGGGEGGVKRPSNLGVGDTLYSVLYRLKYFWQILKAKCLRQLWSKLLFCTVPTN